MSTLTQNRPTPAPLQRVSPRHPDPLEQMLLDDRADWALLKLVLCAAIATLALAVASTLPA